MSNQSLKADYMRLKLLILNFKNIVENYLYYSITKKKMIFPVFLITTITLIYIFPNNIAIFYGKVKCITGTITLLLRIFAIMNDFCICCCNLHIW